MTPSQVNIADMIQTYDSGLRTFVAVLKGDTIVTPGLQLNVEQVWLGGQRCDPLEVVSRNELRCFVQAHRMVTSEVVVVPRRHGLVHDALEGSAMARVTEAGLEWRRLAGASLYELGPRVRVARVNATAPTPWSSTDIMVLTDPTVIGATPAVVEPGGGKPVQLIGR